MPSLNFFMPMDFEAPVSETGGAAELHLRNVHPVVSMALNENARFSGVLSRQYSGGGVKVYIHYSVNGIATGDIKLFTSFERIGHAQVDIDNDSFASAQDTGDITVPGVSGDVDIVNITHTNGTQMDSLAVGEGFRLWIKRGPVDGTDAAGDVEILFIEIRNS